MQETQVIEKPRTVTVDVELFLIWDEETKQYVSYVPSLEMSSYDSGIDIAKKAILELVEDSLEEMMERGTLVKWLLSTGWTVTLKPEPRLIPPRLSIENLNMKAVRIETIPVEIPI